MKNKRLLACLLTLIFVGGLAVSSTFVFRVQEIRLDFANNPTLLTASGVSEDVIKGELKSSIGDAKDKNIIFGLDRDKIRDTLHKNPLVRVKKIEAKFPNILDIRVEERFPIFWIEYGEGLTAVLDYELQMIGSDVDNMANLCEVELVKITTGDLELVDGVSEFKNGENLRKYIADEFSMKRANTLEMMVRYFLGKEANHTESEVCYLIDDVTFTAADSPSGTMTLVLTDPVLAGSFSFELQNYYKNFGVRLQKVWEAFQRIDDKSSNGALKSHENGLVLYIDGSAV